MNKEELIELIESIDVPYIAANRWTAHQPDTKDLCGCVATEALRKLGRDEEVLTAIWHSKNYEDQVRDLAEALEVPYDVLRATISKYDYNACAIKRDLYGDDPIQDDKNVYHWLLRAEDAKGLFIRLLKYYWEKEDEKEVCSDTASDNSGDTGEAPA